MRIDRLYLQDFRNLGEFEVDFDQTSTRQVVVGRNGVGKSNLLEALTWIFRDLDLEEESRFGYEIEYLCNQHCIKITCVQSNAEEFKANTNIPKTPIVTPSYPRSPPRTVVSPKVTISS